MDFARGANPGSGVALVVRVTASKPINLATVLLGGSSSSTVTTSEGSGQVGGPRN